MDGKNKTSTSKSPGSSPASCRVFPSSVATEPQRIIRPAGNLCYFCYSAIPSHKRSVRYCSEECRRARIREYQRNYARTVRAVERACANCGKLFRIRTDNTRGDGVRNRFCSPKCRMKKKVCPVCKRSFTFDFTKQPKRIYCDQKCWGISRRGHPGHK